MHNALQVRKDEQWRRAMEYVSMVSELNYMSQIVVMLYEDPTKDPCSEERCCQILGLNNNIPAQSRHVKVSCQILLCVSQEFALYTKISMFTYVLTYSLALHSSKNLGLLYSRCPFFSLICIFLFHIPPS